MNAYCECVLVTDIKEWDKMWADNIWSNESFRKRKKKYFHKSSLNNKWILYHYFYHKIISFIKITTLHSNFYFYYYMHPIEGKSSITCILKSLQWP